MMPTEKTLQPGEKIAKSLINLRKELLAKESPSNLAMVFKINACLYSEYPKRKTIYVITETDMHGEVGNVLTYENKADAIAVFCGMAQVDGNDCNYRELQSGLLVSAFGKEAFRQDVEAVMQDQDAYAVGSDEWEIQLQLTARELL